jgi:hypothetical protein
VQASLSEENRLRKILTVALIVLALGTGTARAQGVVLQLPPEDQQRITTMLGQGVVGAALPSLPITDAKIYFPLKQKSLTYQVTAGSKIGETQSLGLAQTHRENRPQAWRFQFSPSLAGFVRQTPDGDLIMPAVSDSGEGVLVVSTPANPFVPKGMQPGESRPYTQKIAVDYLDDPSDQRFSGTVNGTYTYMGTYQVTVPAGTFQAILIRVKFKGKVGPADTKDTQYNFFAPGVGVVAMITQEDVQAFWVFNIDTSTGKVLVSR